MRKFEFEPDPGAVIVWSLAILIAAACAAGAWLVVKWSFGL